MPVETTFPFDNVSYGSSALRKMFQTQRSTGYVAGYLESLEVVASSPAAMTVEIKTGAGVIKGALYELAEGGGNKVLSVPANSTGSTRLDRVVLTLDTAAGTLTANYRTGTATVYALVRTATTYEISLAQVSVANGAVSIVTANITSERNDSTVAGAARMLGTSIPIEIMRPIQPFVGTANAHGWKSAAITAGVYSTAFTVPTGKMWLIHELMTPTLGTAVMLAWGAAAYANRIGLAQSLLQFSPAIVVPAGTNLYLYSASAITARFRYTEIDAVNDGRTYQFVSMVTTGTYTPTAGKRFVITSIHMTQPDPPSLGDSSLYDTTLGSTYYVWRSVLTANHSSSFYLYNHQTWDGFKVTDSPGLKEPIICVGGRSITAIGAGAPGEYINLIGYLEDAPLDTHVA